MKKKMGDEDYDFFANHNLMLYAYWKEYMNGQGDAPFFKKKLFMYKIDYNKIVEVLCEVGSALEEKGIRYLVLKGVVIAETYPEPFTRSMGDYDILVHSDDFELAKETLQEIGYITEAKLNTYKDATFFREKELSIELHHALLNPEIEPYAHTFMKQLWDHPIKIETPKGYIMAPQPRMHFTYIVLHMMKHLKEAGFGIRFLLDFKYFAQHHDIDHDAQLAFFEEIGYSEFYRSVATLCHYYLGMNSHDVSWLYDPESPVIRILAEYVAEGGSFGHGSERMRIATHYDKYKDAFKKKKSISVYKELLFPPLSAIIENYKYLERCRFLLPIAWLHRLIKKVFNNRKGIKEKFFIFAQDKEFVSKKEFMMSALKLKNHEFRD
ncbi:nucleotidyltransferase domain-containing protein [Petrocella sp. FN5]|uniref:nucleotidyltransferase domain-containing protein n=1 Tax=Petrocella sp. FN5 TaxID=3032002 RepID=UPI0023DA2F9A|nr:nucleotidyltransferase family protein [Petrocella sp. FN5]MDF1617750.1 nucleotidyltransferase family protein [Petrocella sp. FN5]